jgi:predicted MFS family arabinose efflux permease
MATATNWRAVLVLFVGGIVASLQIGKAAIGVPLLRQELALSLFEASLVVSVYATLAALGGVPVGAAVSRFNQRSLVIAGLLTISIGSTLGAMASSAGFLLLTRILEGCGLLITALATPGMLRLLAAHPDRPGVLALWGAYLPAGSAAMMFGGPYLAEFGWQGLWLANGILAAAYAPVVWLLIPSLRDPADVPHSPILRDVARVLTAPGPLAVGFAFALYGFQFLALAGLLPTLLIERLGLTVSQAGAVSAAAVLANAIGNVMASVAIWAGMPVWSIVALAFAFMGLSTFGVFSETLPVIAIAVLAWTSLFVTGFIPASILAASTRLAPSAALFGITYGLMSQTGNAGHMLGPALLGAWAQAFGWSSASLLFGIVALCGIGAALWLRRLLHREPA